MADSSNGMTSSISHFPVALLVFLLPLKLDAIPSKPKRLRTNRSNYFIVPTKLAQQNIWFWDKLRHTVDVSWANDYSLCSFWTLTWYCNVSRCKVQKSWINIWKRRKTVIHGHNWSSIAFVLFPEAKALLCCSDFFCKMVRESREQSSRQ